MKLKESILIKCEPEFVFNYTQDYNKRLIWDTFLKKAELINTDQAALGVRAWCVSKHGLGMETEYVSFKPPKVTAVTQTKRSLLFKKFSGSWVFEETNEKSTRVTFTYSHKMNFPFSIFSSLIHRVLVSNVKQRLKDLKGCIEKEKA